MAAQWLWSEVGAVKIMIVKQLKVDRIYIKVIAYIYKSDFDAGDRVIQGRDSTPENPDDLFQVGIARN